MKRLRGPVNTNKLLINACMLNGATSALLTYIFVITLLPVNAHIICAYISLEKKTFWYARIHISLPGTRLWP